MKRKMKMRGNISNLILEHIADNIKTYILLVVSFTVGIILATTIINISGESTKLEITNYINKNVDNLNNDINTSELAINGLKNNMICLGILWLLGTTGIGIVLIYLLVMLKGFCLSYSISAIIATLGIGKGLLFSIVNILFQNLFLIPLIFFLACKGIRLSRQIINKKNHSNFKTEILRYSMLLFITVAVLVIIFLLEKILYPSILKVCINQILS